MHEEEVRMSNAGEELIVEQEAGLAILRLNRPKRLNAISHGILHRLEIEVPRLVAASDVRAIMITGTGRAFCAGGDVGAMNGASNADAALTGMQSYHPWLKALFASEQLVITAVNGVAAGGGFGLAMIGDLIVASEDAFFKSAFSTLGLAADFGLAFTLPRAIGAARAAEILFSDRRIAARQAFDIGMISQVFPAETFSADALEFARGIGRTSRGAQLTKRLLRFEQQEAFARYLEMEAQTQTEAFQSADFREGVSAFRESRTPVFRGR
jgi:2-(1,2-epoxy-1,2-dihydrophenyl)acetyl-CoA isomerase